MVRHIRRTALIDSQPVEGRMQSAFAVSLLAASVLAGGSAIAATVICNPSVDPTKFRVTVDIPYMEYDGAKQFFDFYKPLTVSNPPLIIFVHGGAWAKGSKDNAKFVAVAQRLSMMGFAVANFDYPLWSYRNGVVKDGFPAGISALRCGARYLMSNASRLGFDATRISYMGTSAGANLSAILAYAGAQNGNLNRLACASASAPLPRAKSVILYYPPTDLLDTKVPTDISNAQDPNGSGGIAFSNIQWVVRYLNNDVGQFGRQASILPYLNAEALGAHFNKDIETLIVHGDKDQDVDIRQSQLLNAKLGELAMFKTFVVEKGYPHGFAPFRVPSSCDLVTFLNRFAR